MWTLVFIIFLDNGELQATDVGNYRTMYKCFADREQLAVTAGGEQGYFPPGMQGICVYRDSPQT